MGCIQFILTMAPKVAPKGEAKAKAKGEAKKVKKEKTEDEAPKVQEPDEKAYQEALNKVQAKIDALQKNNQELSAKIQERSAGKDEFFQEKAKIRSELDEVQS